MSKVLIGGIIGAVVIFMWMTISWTVLPWHQQLLKGFKNPDVVAQVIARNVEKDGEYLYPYGECSNEGCSKEMQERLTKGPFIYAQVRMKGMDPMNPMLYVVSFVEAFIGALFTCYLLRNLKTMTSYLRRVYFGGIFGLVIGILAAVPNWNWMGASKAYSLTLIANYVIGYLLVGIIVGGFMKPRDIS